MSAELIWPPNYTLKQSKRARYVRLVIDPEVGLQLVVPPHVSESEAVNFMLKQRAWLQKHAAKINHFANNQQEITTPCEINLRCVPQTWQVHTVAVTGRRIKCQEFHNTLVLMGKANDFCCFIPLVKRWLREKAEETLVAMLDEMSEFTGLDYRQVSFRAQKSMWGSCSKEGDISLNIKLLFLPKTLARYVIIHELCHTKHFNHSQRFWAWVARFEPNYMHLKQQLLKADQFIPRWFYVN